MTDHQQSLRRLEPLKSAKGNEIAWITPSGEICVTALWCDIHKARTIRDWLNGVLPPETVSREQTP